MTIKPIRAINFMQRGCLSVENAKGSPLEASLISAHIVNHECRIWGMIKWNVHESAQFEILSRAVHQPVVWMQRRSSSLLVDDKMKG